MKCPKCKSEMILLLDNYVCDVCDQAEDHNDISDSHDDAICTEFKLNERPNPCREISLPHNHEKEDDLVIIQDCNTINAKIYAFKKSEAVSIWPGAQSYSGTMYKTKTGKYVLVYKCGSNYIKPPREAMLWFAAQGYKIPYGLESELKKCIQI